MFSAVDSNTIGALVGICSPLSASLHFLSPPLFPLYLRHLFVCLLLPLSPLFSTLPPPASPISLSFSHSPPSWRRMLICQALCILQPPATVALKWHHTGGLGLSHLRPYLPHLISLHLFAAAHTRSRLKAAMWEQKMNARTTVQIVLV